MIAETGPAPAEHFGPGGDLAVDLEADGSDEVPGHWVIGY